MVKVITTLAEYVAITKKANAKVVVDFFATWCGPCVKIAPVYSDIATANPEVEFYKVDVDASPEIAEAEKISSMPTFKFYNNGVVIATISGANEQKI